METMKIQWNAASDSVIRGYAAGTGLDLAEWP
jgi:hypothetical protein